MRIVCLRHGETNYNIAGLCNDDPRDDVHLTPRGIEQARAAGRALAHERFDRVFVSPLPRTQETARIVLGAREVALEVRSELHDIHNGFNGRPVAEYYAAIAHDKLNAHVPGHESLLDHKRRVRGFIDWLVQQDARQVLVVAHEETLRVFYAYFHPMDDIAMAELKFGNCEVLRFDTGRFDRGALARARSSREST